MCKVLGVINSLGTGGAEKLILDSAPLIEKQITFDFLFLKKDNYPFEQAFKNNFNSNVFFSTWKSVYNPLHIFTVIKYLKKYDVVHVHLFPAFYWVVIAKIISFSQIKIVYTEHSTSNRRMRNPLFKTIDKIIYNQLDAVITISDKVDVYLKDYLNKTKTKFFLIKNGINLNKINQATAIAKTNISEAINNQSILLLQVSSFHHPKDQLTVVSALNHLPNHVVALFAGDGVDKQKVINYCNENNLINRVFFLGMRSDIPQLLKTADIVVLSSHYEGLSLSSIEGMASGKPFIASDVPGLHEVVKGAGLLFEDKNDKQLAQHIQKLIEDKAFYEQTANACQERAKQYDIKEMVKKQVKLYKNLCQNKSK